MSCTQVVSLLDQERFERGYIWFNNVEHGLFIAEPLRPSSCAKVVHLAKLDSRPWRPSNQSKSAIPDRFQQKFNRWVQTFCAAKKNIGTIVCYSMLCEWMMMGYVLTPNCKVDTALRRPLVTKHWHKCLAYQCEWEVKQQHARHAMNSESSWVLRRFVFAKAVQYCIHRTC